MDSGNGVTGMAIDTERRRRYRGGVAMVVAVEIQSVALGAGMAAIDVPAKDVGRMRTVHRVFQDRRRGVAVGATAVMDDHRASWRMANRHAGGIVKNDT